MTHRTTRGSAADPETVGHRTARPDPIDSARSMSQTAAMTTTGADQLIANAVHNGIDVCFANPGTTELHLIEALDRQPGMRSILAAFEGVCSGAADGYARMAGKPALGLFHLGPGFANSLANQHNARRHHTPMINLIGDQASWHLEYDAPLTSDIDALGRWTGHTMYTPSAAGSGQTMADAVAFSLSGDQRIVNLVMPADHAWTPTEVTLHDADVAPRFHPDAADIARAADELRTPGAALIVGGAEVDAEAVRLLGRIRRATGASIHLTRTAKLEVGRHLPMVRELPYFPAPLMAALAEVTTAVMVGRTEPVTFFGYPDTPSKALPADARRLELAGADADVTRVLSEIAARLGATDDEVVDNASLPAVDLGTLDTRNLGTAFAAALPEGAIVVAESVSSGATYRQLTASAAPHTMLAVLGGAIGGGLPSAVGAAVACPDRPVFALQADGSALYTIQSLWTMARESLDITTVICANRRYQILDVELAGAGLDLGAAGRRLTDLAGPAVDHVALAKGFGVPGRNVTTGGELVDALAWAASESGPHLIEAEL